MSKNTLKTGALLLALTMLFLLIGQLIGGRQGMILAFVLACAMNFISYWFSDKIVLAMYGAQQVNESEAPLLHRVVRNLAQRAGLPMPRVYIIPTESPNAFATGRNPEHAAVAATEGILGILNEDELEAVMAHELGHVKNRDILTMSVVATIAGAIMMLASWARFFAFWGSLGDRRDENNGSNLIALLAIAIVAPIAAMLIQFAISRAREFQADATGAKLSLKPLSLASALRKLHSMSMRAPMEANPATAHLFIVNPLSGGSLLKLFSTHPPVEERIKRLEEMARNLEHLR